MKFVVRNEEKEKTAVLIPAGGLDETAFNPIMPYLEDMSGVKYVDGGIRREDNLLVMYGDKDGYKGGIKWFEKHHCPFEKTILKGYGHCEYLYQNSERYVKRYLLQEEL